MDLKKFNKENFKFDHFYRALVEETSDDGRVRVRIWGLHNPDLKITPIEDLPWAEPALPLSFSGGGNIDPEKALSSEDRDDKQKQLEYAADYYAGDVGKTLASTLADNGGDTFSKTGTGGIFTIPRVGNHVWIFFENKSHMHPIYFATCPGETDWEESRENIVDRVTVHNQAVTGAEESKPTIEEVGTNKDITVVGTKKGVSVIIDNTDGKEKIILLGPDNTKSFMVLDHEGDYHLYAGNDRKENIENDTKIHIHNNKDTIIDNDETLYVHNEREKTVDEKEIERDGDDKEKSIEGQEDSIIYKNKTQVVQEDVNDMVFGNVVKVVVGDEVKIIGGDLTVVSSSVIKFAAPAIKFLSA